MKIRVVSSGILLDTRVENADTGELLENVTAVTWAFDAAKRTSKCYLEVILVPCDITSDDVEVKELPIGS